MAWRHHLEMLPADRVGLHRMIERLAVRHAGCPQFLDCFSESLGMYAAVMAGR